MLKLKKYRGAMRHYTENPRKLMMENDLRFHK